MEILGSYLKTDVEILLKEIDMVETNVEEKEKLIQNEKKHYSEMIVPEYIPTEEYIKVFYDAMEINKLKVSENILQLSNYLTNNYNNPIIVSLARAGTPIGVLLKRTLNEVFNKDCSHYSISIIRDRGVDTNAIKYLIEKESKRLNISTLEASKKIVFVDGWTGKGVINRELKKYINEFNLENNMEVSNSLVVLADISGKADVSATEEDYLIPSAALNSTVSGLISRSILNDEFIKDNDFHGCKFYREFIPNDLSLWYINNLMEVIKKLDPKEYNYLFNDNTKKKELSDKCDDFILKIKEEFNISNINYIKPGVGETTRVLLRRIPEVIILRDINSIETKHIVKLAEDKNVKLIEDKNLVYSSLGIIKSQKEK